MKILVTTTSFQDTPGRHLEYISKQGWDIDYLRGPLKFDILLPIIEQYDGVICGDDEYSIDVLNAGKKGKLKGLSKYGVGLDNIDLDHAHAIDIKIKNCPGINKHAVAEHVFALLLSFKKNIHKEYIKTRSGDWPRMLGSELNNSKFGIVGLGNIGKQVASLALAFGCKVYYYDLIEDKIFSKNNNLVTMQNINDLFENVDIVSLHMDLNEHNKKIVSKELIENTKKGIIIVNTARGEIVDENAIIYGIKEKIIGGYLADVLSIEPQKIDNPLKNFEEVLITSHISSKTKENIANQGMMAIDNMRQILSSS